MAAATPYYRIPVVIFAVLVGGLYVYAKGGGSLLSKRPQVTPAANPQGEELAPPRIEFMMGPKSAPAFDKAPTYQPAPPPQQKTQSAPQREVLPGSKSRAVIDPSTFTPANSTSKQSAFPPRQPAPQNNVPRSEPAASQASPRARVLPGSKSMILIDPQTIAPAPNSAPTNANPQPQAQQPAQPAPQRDFQPRNRVLPGSKSAVLIEPSTNMPPSNNLGNRQQVQQPAYRQPSNQQQSYQQPARGNERPYAPNGNTQQRGVSR